MVKKINQIVVDSTIIEVIDDRKESRKFKPPESMIEDQKLAEVQNAFINEAQVNLVAIKINDCDVCSEEYQMMLKNAETCIKSGKLVCDMRESREKVKRENFKSVDETVSDVGKFVCDYTSIGRKLRMM